jgi:hypothetical protein
MPAPLSFLSKTSLLSLALAALGACSMGASERHSHKLSARLTGSAEVPGNPSTATGTLEASLNRDTHLLRWTVAYSGLTGPVKAAHFHGPAVIGQNAGVSIPFSGSLGSPIEGQATLTPEQAADLLAGKWYVNLHTANFPGGEIRGQASLNK